MSARQPIVLSTKHHRQASLGSNDCTTGWPVAWKCAVACLLGEELQHPM
jgi:hypothetical protein